MEHIRYVFQVLSNRQNGQLSHFNYCNGDKTSNLEEEKTIMLNLRPCMRCTAQTHIQFIIYTYIKNGPIYKKKMIKSLHCILLNSEYGTKL